MNDAAVKPVMTKQELAEYLGISVRQVDYLRKDGLPVLKLKSSVRFMTTQVVAWIKTKSEGKNGIAVQKQ
jgi:phage terminase Nu1 subunit (DNA packaging protein)